MTKYKNLNGNSGILGYEAGLDFILIEFSSGKYTFYKYTNTSVGSSNLETMKSLAVRGYGLHSFIRKNPDINNRYSEKW